MSDDTTSTDSPTLSLGDKIKDKITGVEGTLIGKFDKISTPTQLLMTALDAAGKPFEHWIEIGRAALIGIDEAAKALQTVDETVQEVTN